MMPRRWPPRWWALLALFFGFALTFAASPVLIAGQPPAKPPVKEEEDDEKPPKAAEVKPAAPAKPPPPPKPKVQLDLSTGPFNLADQAKQQTAADAKALLEEFAIPHDIVVTRNSTGTDSVWKVVPIPKKYVPEGLGTVNVKTIDGKREAALKRDQIKEVSHYEPRALAAVTKFQLANQDKSGIARFHMLRAAEMVLAEVSRFHEDARRTRAREGAEWDEIARQIKSELFRVQVNQVLALAADQEWGYGQTLAERLFNENPGNRELLAAIETMVVSRAQLGLDTQNDFLGARRLIEEMAAKFRMEILPESAAGRIQRRLVDRARLLYEEGKLLAEQGKVSEALTKLEGAEEAWPTYPGLRVYRQRLIGDRPTLRVGVRYLPTQVSPTTMATDADLAAVSLVFESILQLRSGPSGRDGYIAKLGDEPSRIEQGWEVVVPEGLAWSDGKPMTADDLLRSAELYSKRGSFLYNPDAEQLKVVPLDSQRITFTLQRPYLDPLSLLTFPLVPAHRLPRGRSPRDLAFGRAPVGSGPFMVQSGTEDEVVLVANPHYRRYFAPTGPAIQEIRFIRYDDFSVAKNALSSGRWQLLLDLSTKERDELAGIPNTTTVTPTEATTTGMKFQLTNPRIYYLAVNHRKTPLQNANLRRAISQGIDREGVLSAVYRGKGKPQHKVLNGPFPLGSWAYDENLDRTPATNTATSRVTLQQARNDLRGSLPTLTLRYANEERGAAEACAEMQKNLESIGLRINLQGMAASEILSDLARETPTYDLLYWTYDFQDEMLSLWPLFDPQSAGGQGQNILGFKDGTIEGVFRTIQNLRDLDKLTLHSKRLHDMIMKQLPMIPLWQLDKHIAVHRSLQYTRIHPVRVFDNPELWRIVAE